MTVMRGSPAISPTPHMAYGRPWLSPAGWTARVAKSRSGQSLVKPSAIRSMAGGEKLISKHESYVGMVQGCSKIYQQSKFTDSFVKVACTRELNKKHGKWQDSSSCGRGQLVKAPSAQQSSRACYPRISRISVQVTPVGWAGCFAARWRIC